MSDTINDGGPAFQQPNHVIDTDRGRQEARDWMSDSGMSLRDWFAGMALQGICASESDDFGFAENYLGLDGKPTYRRTMYPLKPDGAEDYSKPQIELKVYKTKHQQEAEEAYRRADAMLSEREKGKA